MKGLALLCAMLAVAIGFLAIAGWVLELPILASLGPGWIPMAPSSALLFILFGTALFFSIREPLARGVRRAGVAVGSVGALVGLVLLPLLYLDIHPDVEHLGIVIDHMVDGAPTGHMSPATALCFFVGGLSLVTTLLSSSERPRLAMAGSWLAGLMVLVSVIFLLAYLFGMPLLYGGTFVPPALPASIALTALGVALLGLAQPRIGAPGLPVDAPTRRAMRIFMLVYALMSAGLVSGGAIYFRSVAQEQRAEIEHQLSAIAELKVMDLVNWRAERIGDATLLQRNAIFAGLVRRSIGAPPDAQARDEVRTWLRQIKEAYAAYRAVSLIDAQGVARISIPDAVLAANELKGARRALLSGKVTLEDFHREEPGGEPDLSLLVPIFDHRAGGRPLGVVMLEIDPGRYLYPHIGRWPTPSRSAETLLVRRDGNDVLYLNELRFQKNTALSLRFPLTRTEIPAVRAALGQEGVVEGIDYRGRPVIAALRQVPGTPWHLIARVDTDELFQSTANSLGLAAGLIAVVLLSAGAALRTIWRQQVVLRYKEQSRGDELAKLARELARSNEELQQFAYVASHDLQEPLRMVVGYVQLLENRLADKLDTETRKFMHFAMDGAMRMQALIQDILAYSRVSTQAQPFAPVDSAAALKEALVLLASRIAETGAEVDAQALPMVTADGTQLVQLFQNLIGNALKFCKGHAPRVRVEAVHEEGRWRFSVTDNGIGIAPEYRGQIFVVFKRLHTRREYPGTGIGLAICKRIIERHGGQIGIDAAPGGGSAFWFTLADSP